MTANLLVRDSRASGRGAACQPGRLLPCGLAESPSLAGHLARHGSLPDGRGKESWQLATSSAIREAGLVGRGGAAFPTDRKLDAVRSGRGKAVVIANGTEGEPASRKDRVLLSRAPHLVLDGASVAADLVSAAEVVAVVHPVARRSVDAAVAERGAAGIDRVPIRVVTAADRFVAGEASAVVNWVQRRTPVPRATPPRMSEHGLNGRPTLVQNVETLAHMALIARHGADWYRSLGTAEEPGSTLVTLLGAVARPGVYEVEIGRAIHEVIALAGGATDELQALLIGGYAGSWVPAGSALELPFSAQGLGVGLGAGVVAALPSDVCGMVETARLARYLASQSAGQCGPCVFGLPSIADQVAALAAGRPGPFGDLERWLEEIIGRGACGHPDGVARMVQSALRVFAGELSDHRMGRCRVSEAARTMQWPIPDVIP